MIEDHIQVVGNAFIRRTIDILWRTIEPLRDCTTAHLLSLRLAK